MEAQTEEGGCGGSFAAALSLICVTAVCLLGDYLRMDQKIDLRDGRIPPLLFQFPSLYAGRQELTHEGKYHFF